MLRSLLADRVKLELHHVKKEASVYGLMVWRRNVGRQVENSARPLCNNHSREASGFGCQSIL
jgi:uncharacterized protein (TIGR03435 family)